MTETQAMQPFDWDLYSNFSRIWNVIAFCMKFKTKNKRPRKADESFQADQLLFWFFPHGNFPECFDVGKNQQGNLEKLERCQIVKLHRARCINSSERSIECFMSSMARERSQVAEKILFCNGATHVPITTPGERRKPKKVISTYHRNKCQRRVGLQT